MNDFFLSCFVAPGMFSDELAIKYPPRRDLATQVNSFFVPKSEVAGNENEIGKVRVRAFKEGNIFWAVLPTENQVVIPVEDHDLIQR